MTRTLPSAFARYVLVGAAATLAHYALLASWVEALHGAAWIGSGLGATLGAQVAFFGNRAFTFGHSGPLFPAWWRFQGTAVLGALVGMAVVAAGVAAGWHYLLAQVLATGISLVLTFLINRRWTFA